eukprot:CAMPEP_0183415930 /NCGR_PEP_ID=MMETSP0370-20130417/23432_1 /TAXON_ID=268820 /ORGANISM="Peridinium aciculiferum, Strain PAER-2" /LENGTH=35 /DNA_ID= /DNA_START= /DNA_END= /DNA_ORIENTATION=
MTNVARGGHKRRDWETIHRLPSTGLSGRESLFKMD